MRLISLTKIIICFLAVLISLSSCNSKESGRRSIVCLVDFSDSKDATERLQFYMTAIRDNVIPKLSYTDKITVIPIDKASITNASDILLADLAKHDFEPESASPMEEEQITKDNLKKYTDSLAAVFARNFQSAIEGRNKTSHGTDIFGALEVTKTKLAESDNNIVFLFSDMMNYSGVIKMEPGNSQFGSNTIEAVLKKVAAVHLPNTVALVLTADQSYIPQEHFKLVQSFWTKYFENNGIKLYDYSSASLSKLNELMSMQQE